MNRIKEVLKNKGISQTWLAEKTIKNSTKNQLEVVQRNRGIIVLYFQRKGNDLITKKSIDLYTALLGGKIEIPTINGIVNMNVPRGTQNGKTLRLKGKGMPVYNSKSFGDLLVQIEVVLPKSLTKEEEELFKRLQTLATQKRRTTV